MVGALRSELRLRMSRETDEDTLDLRGEAERLAAIAAEQPPRLERAVGSVVAPAAASGEIERSIGPPRRLPFALGCVRQRH
jgi:hypothetical protein